jgi:hypothetical protein
VSLVIGPVIVPIPLRVASDLAWTPGANPHGDLLLRR